MYKELAPFYDNAFRDRFSEVVAGLIVEAFADLGVEAPSSLLDLGCGTGGLAMALCKARYEVTGLDRSERMLDIARRRAEKEAVPLDLRVGDVREFRFSDPFDAALCTGDVINHLLGEEDLRRLLACTRASLVHRGALIFDVNTLQAFRSRLWNAEETSVETDAFTIASSARFSEQSQLGRLDMRVVERTMMTEYDRRASLRERYWDPETLSALLEQEGFTVLGVSPFHPLAMAEELPELSDAKALWVCRRR